MSDLRDNTRVLHCAAENPYPNQVPDMGTGPETWQSAFPTICPGTHWDNTLISRRFFPDGPVVLPTDERPLAKICTSYYTSDDGSHLDGPYASVRQSLGTHSFLPTGGAAGRGAPYEGYAAAIDAESSLFGRNQPAGKLCRMGEQTISCEAELFKPRSYVPLPTTNTTTKEMDRPAVTVFDKPYKCRAENDLIDDKANSRLFNNSTKYNKQHPPNRPQLSAPIFQPLE